MFLEIRKPSLVLSDPGSGGYEYRAQLRTCLSRFFRGAFDHLRNKYLGFGKKAGGKTRGSGRINLPVLQIDERRQGGGGGRGVQDTRTFRELLPALHAGKRLVGHDRVAGQGNKVPYFPGNQRRLPHATGPDKHVGKNLCPFFLPATNHGLQFGNFGSNFWTGRKILRRAWHELTITKLAENRKRKIDFACRARYSEPNIGAIQRSVY